MANEEHVARLKKGVATWNAWRTENKGVVQHLAGADLSDAALYGAILSAADLSDADLSGADLSGADLFGADLRDANLGHTDLSDADLRGANLNRADLFGADLSRAFLSNADLSGANLGHVDLSGANLNRADLFGADLRGANLSAHLGYANLDGAHLTGANLSDATLIETFFTNVDLSKVMGLATCLHFGPSIIDVRTLEKSPDLPLAFLRGVGLPDRLIDYLPSLFNQAIQFYSCFISYSAKDQDVAERLHADLQNKGVRCWFAPHDLPIGAKILDGIDEAIRLRDKVLLILSEHSIKSDWVEDEVTTAFEEERKREQPMLFPIRLDDTVMDTQEAWAAKLRARNIGDFRHWKDHDKYTKSLERVLRDLSVSVPVP
jgi:hypothetical protein